MAFFNAPGQPQGMYGDATLAAYQQPMPTNPQQQQPAQQPHPAHQFHPGQRPMPQFPNLHSPSPNPNFLQQQQQQQQMQLQLQQQRQAHGFQQQGMNPPHPHQPLQLQHQQQQYPQMHMQNQFPEFNAAPSPMAPPSSGPMSLNMNPASGMQPGGSQRPPPPQQLHTRNSSQAMQYNNQDNHNWSAPTPPSGATTNTFFPQATPSPTKTTAPPPSAPGAGVPAMPAASPQSQTTGLQGRPQSAQPPRPILQGPLSPEDAKRETQRVGALLDINRILLQEIVQLQLAGRAGPPQKPGADHGGQASPTVTENGAPETKDGEGESKDGEGEKKKQISSREYIECMRRVQANLAYLAVIADRSHKPLDKIPEKPAIMEPLPPIPGNTVSEETLQSLRDAYKSLKELWPPGGGGSGSQSGTPVSARAGLGPGQQLPQQAQVIAPAAG